MGIKKGNRLSSMTFDEVSVVTNPANQHSRIILWKSGDIPPDYSREYIEKRQFTAERREELASEGKALPDRSFPIENSTDLKNAIKAIGRAGPPGEGPSPARRAQIKAHIKRRAKALGLTSMLEGTWVEKAGGACSYDHRKLSKNQRCPDCGMRSSGRGGKMRKSSTLAEKVAAILKAASSSRALEVDDANDEDSELDALVSDYSVETADNKEDSPMGKLHEDIDLDSLDEDVRKAFEELVKDNTTMAKGLVKKQEEIDNLNEALDELDDDDVDDKDLNKSGDDDGNGNDDGDMSEGDIAKALAEVKDPAARAIVEKALKDAESARLAVKDALEKAEEERSIRLDKEYIAKAETDFHHLAMKPEEIGPALRQLHDHAPALYEALEKVLKGADAAVKQSAITKTIGADGNREDVVGGSVIDQVEAKAAELRKSDKNLSKEGAIAKVLQDEPELYHEYNQKKRQDAFARQMPNV